MIKVNLGTVELKGSGIILLAELGLASKNVMEVIAKKDNGKYDEEMLDRMCEQIKESVDLGKDMILNPEDHLDSIPGPAKKALVDLVAALSEDKKEESSDD